MRTAVLRWKRTGPQIMLSTEQRKYNNTVHPKDTSVASFINYTATGSRHTRRNENNNIAQYKNYITLFILSSIPEFVIIRIFFHTAHQHEGNKYDGGDIT